jgi:hypothetical protein
MNPTVNLKMQTCVKELAKKDSRAQDTSTIFSEP